MKHLTILVLVLVVAQLARPVRAQTGGSWIEVAPRDELFRVSMAATPESKDQREKYGELSVNGKRYSAVADGARYTVWSLVDVNYHSTPSSEIDLHLDACADLIWESLLKPDRDKLPRDGRARAGMTYVRELPANPLVGREYSVTIGDLSGLTRFYVADARIYILLALDSPQSPWQRERFLQSFAIKPGSLPATIGSEQPAYGGVGPGVRGNVPDSVDYNRIFSAREITERARILEKAEPSYTESARKYGVQGTVMLRAVFAKGGQVTNIVAVKRLPHGLTQAAITAARGIRFVPAVKDGHQVSQWIQLEYNFNLY